MTPLFLFIDTMPHRSELQIRARPRGGFFSTLLAIGVSCSSVSLSIGLAGSSVAYFCYHTRYIGRSLTAESFASEALRDFYDRDCKAGFSRASDYGFPYFPYVGTRDSGKMITTVEITEKPSPQYRIIVKREGDRVPLRVYAGGLEQYGVYNICDEPKEISPIDGRPVSGFGYLLQRSILGGLTQG